MITIKRVSFLLCIIVFLFSASVNVQAATTISHIVNEIDISIDIPSDLNVFTRDIAQDDPNLSYYGLDRASLIKSYKDSNIYLNAVSENALYEIIVTMIEYAGSKEISISDCLMIPTLKL